MVLEESFERTLWFVERIAGRTAVIIPHLGMMNGDSHSRLAREGVWEKPWLVYADTALASSGEMAQFLERYGSEQAAVRKRLPLRQPPARTAEGQEPSG